MIYDYYLLNIFNLNINFQKFDVINNKSLII